MKHVASLSAAALVLLCLSTQLGIAQSLEEYKVKLKDRIGFIIGGGVAIIATPLYLDPIIDKADNSVIIEKASVVKPNLSLGISYTHRMKHQKRTIRFFDNEKRKADSLIMHQYFPAGISYSLFLSPVSFSQVSSISLANNVDLGLGIGYRLGGFSIFLTTEFFSIRQPKAYFIERHMNNDKPLVINGETQSLIDTKDSSIFSTRVATAFGIKLCYTFATAKHYYSRAMQAD